MTNYLINVNQEETLTSTSEITTLDLIKIDDSNFHLLDKNQSYRINLQQADYNNKTLTVLVNGNKYELKIEDESRANRK